MDPFTCGQPLAPRMGAYPSTKLRFIWAATTSDSLDTSSRVRGLDDRSFIPADCNDATWTGHLKLKISVM